MLYINCISVLKRKEKRMRRIYIYITEPFCCTLDTNTIMYIKYSLIKK